MFSKKFYEFAGSEGYSYRYLLDVQQRAGEERGRALAHGISVIGTYAGKWFVSLREALRRDATYAELKRLDDHMLQDIGLTRGDIRRVVHSGPTPANTNDRPIDSKDVA